MPDLIDLDFARQHIPTSQDTDEPIIIALLSAASQAIIRYCRRDFSQQNYDELYNGTGDKRLHLREYPITSIQSVRYRPVTVLKIINNLINTPQARVSVTPTSITLLRVTAGISTTDASILFAGNPTLASVQIAVNAVGNGWSATSQGYDQWPSADLYCPNGPTANSNNSQGALTAAGQFAELKMHTYELAGFQWDSRRGWLLRAIPYTDPELLHPEDLIWPVGINNFRVQYTAGFSTIPVDVQEATAELAAGWFMQRGRDMALSSERTQGSYSYVAQMTRAKLPERIRAILAPYRQYRISTNQS